MSSIEPARRPDPFSYHDPSRFLVEFLDHLRESNPEFSIRRLVQGSEVSLGYLSNIVHGKRRLSTKGLQRLLPLLPVSPAESSYLLGLSQAVRAKENELRVQAIQRLQRFQKYSELNPKEVILFRYFSKWYVPAIRELASLEGFSLDPRWIQRNLKYTVELPKIEKATRFLLESGIFQRDEQGRVRVPEARIEGQADVLRVSLMQHHCTMLDLAKLSMEKTSADLRKITGYTFSISQDRLERAKAVIDNAIAELVKLSEQSDRPTAVYQCSMALFPLTREKVEPV